MPVDLLFGPVGCDQNVTTYDFDPEKAKALLAEAGYGGGLTLSLAACREHHISEAVINYFDLSGPGGRGGQHSRDL